MWRHTLNQELVTKRARDCKGAETRRQHVWHATCHERLPCNLPLPTSLCQPPQRTQQAEVLQHLVTRVVGVIAVDSHRWDHLQQQQTLNSR